MWTKYKIGTNGVAVVIEELKQCISAKAHIIRRCNDRICIISKTSYLRLTRGIFTKNLMTNNKVINRFLVLIKPESLGVLSRMGQWNTEEMLVG